MVVIMLVRKNDWFVKYFSFQYTNFFSYQKKNTLCCCHLQNVLLFYDIAWIFPQEYTTAMLHQNICNLKFFCILKDFFHRILEYIINNLPSLKERMSNEYREFLFCRRRQGHRRMQHCPADKYCVKQQFLGSALFDT